jgi:hypothetical protein
MSSEHHDDIPTVVRTAADAAFKTCIGDEKGRGTGFCFRLLHDDLEDTWIIQIAPEPGELVGGKGDGESIFDPIDVDLLTLPACLDFVGAFSYDPGTPHLQQGPNIRLVGDKEGQRIAIQINLFPFGDTEASWVFDTNQGEWREPRG